MNCRNLRTIAQAVGRLEGGSDAVSREQRECGSPCMMQGGRPRQHGAEVARRVERQITLHDGKIIKDDAAPNEGPKPNDLILSEKL